MISLLAPISLVMAANSELVLSVWTGNNVIATHSADVLTCYALGNLFLLLLHSHIICNMLLVRLDYMYMGIFSS